jgi:hypothetical protein
MSEKYINKNTILNGCRHIRMEIEMVWKWRTYLLQREISLILYTPEFHCCYKCSKCPVRCTLLAGSQQYIQSDEEYFYHWCLWPHRLCDGLCPQTCPLWVHKKSFMYSHTWKSNGLSFGDYSGRFCISYGHFSSIHSSVTVENRCHFDMTSLLRMASGIISWCYDMHSWNILCIHYTLAANMN